MAEYIERRMAVDAIAEIMATGFVEDRFILPHELQDLQDELEALPTADVAPVVHGRWIHTNSLCDPFCEVWRCSCCSAEDENGACYNYCPNCGAKMDQE